VFSKAEKVTEREDHKSGAREEGPTLPLKDEELVARAQKDDLWATGELIRRYQQKAYAIAFQMSLGNREEAEDITQEAFLRAFRKIKKFRGGSSFYTWLYRIVVNTCIDAIRGWRRRERVFSPRRARDNQGESSVEVIQEQPDMAQESNPMAALSVKQLSQEAKEALMSLTEKQRVAFQLKVFQGMSIREIAEMTQSAEGTVKSHLFRATHVLREALKDWAEP
jgi:RNA polymerase sigma-70 factor (ECF subfamily)